jgi:hypothetical protein
VDKIPVLTMAVGLDRSVKTSLSMLDLLVARDQLIPTTMTRIHAMEQPQPFRKGSQEDQALMSGVQATVSRDQDRMVMSIEEVTLPIEVALASFKKTSTIRSRSSDDVMKTNY